MPRDQPLFTPRLEQALRDATRWHRHQTRKQVEGDDPRASIPYVQHVVAVALILDRLGYPEDVVIAGLLHDAVEDTPATLAEVREAYGDPVADLVAACTERKTEAGSEETRPWEVRKAEHLDHLKDAPHDVRAVVLADKLHNLLSMVADLDLGPNLWARFNAPPDRIFWYYGSMIDLLGTGDDRLTRLANACRDALNTLKASVVSEIDRGG